MTDALCLEKEIREICLLLLTRREHSQLELLDKLALKGYERSVTQRLVDKLAEEGWQSDQRFAEAYARFRIKKGFGPVKINYELRQRGITGFDLDAVVMDLAEGWEEVISQIYSKKFTDEGALTQQQRLKRSRFLLQRGFSHEMIKTVLK